MTVSRKTKSDKRLHRKPKELILKRCYRNNRSESEACPSDASNCLMNNFLNLRFLSTSESIICDRTCHCALKNASFQLKFVSDRAGKLQLPRSKDVKFVCSQITYWMRQRCRIILACYGHTCILRGFKSNLKSRAFQICKCKFVFIFLTKDGWETENFVLLG